MDSERMFFRLDFSNSNITDETLTQLVMLNSSCLKELRLENCDRLTERAYLPIGDCTKLRRLSICESSSLRDSSLEKILFNATDLEYLNLSRCRGLTSQSLRHIRRLQRLRSLTMPDTGTYTGDEVWWSVGNIRTLQYLGLESVFLLKNLRYLTNLKGLRSLKLAHFKVFHSASTCAYMICEIFDGLEELHFSCSSDVSVDIGTIIRRLKNLRTFRFSCPDVFANDIFSGGVGSSSMKTLRVDSELLSDDGLASVAAHHPRLESLSLRGCRKITYARLESLLSSEPHLKKLELDSKCLSEERGKGDKKRRRKKGNTIPALRRRYPHLKVLINDRLFDSVPLDFRATFPSHWYKKIENRRSFYRSDSW